MKLRTQLSWLLVVAFAVSACGESGVNPYHAADLGTATAFDLIIAEDDGRETWLTVSNDEEVARLAESLDAALTTEPSGACPDEMELRFFKSDGSTAVIALACDGRLRSDLWQGEDVFGSGAFAELLDGHLEQLGR